MIKLSKPQQMGFTLIETLIAMVILASALLLLTNSWSGSTLRVKKTQQLFEVAALLEKKMTDIELEYRGKSLDEIQDEKSDDFGSEYPQYSWKMTSKKLEIPDLSATLTSKNEGADPTLMSLIKQLTEGLSKAIKEVTVTVIYKGGVKPVEYSITTYFIDYDQEFQMGAPGG